jgi:dienelactone hydrolase
MRRLTILLVALIAFRAGAAEPAPQEAPAKAFVTALADGRFADAAKDFDDAMKKALPNDKLEELWKKVETQVGPLQKQLGVRVENEAPFVIAYVRCQFGKALLDVKVVFDKQNRITGLNFVPATTGEQFPPPPYAEPDKFREVQVKVGTGEWVLPGTLTIPKGDGPFPAVVLVHGSGPQDRDETIGRVKPFRDLAWGLASRGIAVLRYEKVTKQYGAKVVATPSFTVKEETIDHAVAAAELLRNTSGIDAKRVFVIGHSQGALMAPRIALAGPSIAGIVMLAAPSRPLEDLILEQTHAGLEKRDKLPMSEVQLLEALQKIGQLIKDGKLTANTPRSDLLGMTPVYWKSLAGYTAIADARNLNRPMLILQGDADDEVTMTDYAGWRAAMVDHKNATLKSYAKLNHLFTPDAAQGKSTHVSAEIVSDIADWIKKH